jgi:hypothetical protein
VKKLQLDTLTVDSFATTEAMAVGRGTVRGRSEVPDDSNDCDGSFTVHTNCEVSCRGTCDFTCAASCQLTCHQTCRVTCQ